jgi:predicted PurR-regulated permease PerM
MKLQMPFVIAAFLSFAVLLYAMQYQSIATANYTVEEANSIINSVLSYTNLINQSSYLIFSPNLKNAYTYLENASSIYNTSPGEAVAYALKAKEIAQAQYNAINSYRLISFVAMLAFSIIALYLLLIYMKPVKHRIQLKGKKNK